MAYRTRSNRRYVKNSRRNFVVTVIIIILLLFATFQWVLPTLVNGVGLVTGIFKFKGKTATNLTENATLAPPILNIPFEATNTARIDIKGYSIAGAKVKLFLDDSEVQTVDVSESGDFIFKSVTLSLGTNNIYAKTLDEDDRESLPSKSFRVIYDNEKPPLKLSEPEDGKKIQGGDKRVKFDGTTEAGAAVFISSVSENQDSLINDSQVIVDKDGNFSSDQTLNDGDNNFTVKSVDPAGNFTEIVRKITYQP